MAALGGVAVVTSILTAGKRKDQENYGDNLTAAPDLERVVFPKMSPLSEENVKRQTDYYSDPSQTLVGQLTVTSSVTKAREIVERAALLVKERGWEDHQGRISPEAKEAYLASQAFTDALEDRKDRLETMSVRLNFLERKSHTTGLDPDELVDKSNLEARIAEINAGNGLEVTPIIIRKHLKKFDQLNRGFIDHRQGARG